MLAAQLRGLITVVACIIIRWYMYLGTGSYDNIKNRIHRLSYRNSGGSIDEASYVTDTSGSDVTVKNRLMAPWKPSNDVTSGCALRTMNRVLNGSSVSFLFHMFQLGLRRVLFVFYVFHL